MPGRGRCGPGRERSLFREPRRHVPGQVVGPDRREPADLRVPQLAVVNGGNPKDSTAAVGSCSWRAAEQRDRPSRVARYRFHTGNRGQLGERGSWTEPSRRGSRQACGPRRDGRGRLDGRLRWSRGSRLSAVRHRCRCLRDRRGRHRRPNGGRRGNRDSRGRRGRRGRRRGRDRCRRRGRRGRDRRGGRRRSPGR